MSMMVRVTVMMLMVMIVVMVDPEQCPKRPIETRRILSHVLVSKQEIFPIFPARQKIRFLWVPLGKCIQSSKGFFADGTGGSFYTRPIPKLIHDVHIIVLVMKFHSDEMQCLL